jgi:hypothetical protein
MILMHFPVNADNHGPTWQGTMFCVVDAPGCMLMDMIQDGKLLTALRSRASIPPVEMTQNSMDLLHWPHTRPDGQLGFRCEKSFLYCQIALDGAGYIVTNLARSPNAIWPCAGRPLGGIRLAHGVHGHEDADNADESARDESAT